MSDCANVPSISHHKLARQTTHTNDTPLSLVLQKQLASHLLVRALSTIITLLLPPASAYQP